MLSAQMRTLLLLLSCVQLACADLKVVEMSMQRTKRPAVQKRDLQPIALQGIGGILYAVNASVGTPPQQLHFHIDTGSSDVVMPAAGTQDCPNCDGDTCEYHGSRS